MLCTSEEHFNDNEEHLSKIRVKYNLKFIEFIKKLRRENDTSTLYLNELDKILPLQEELREYIVKNQELFELQYGKLDFGSNSHPDFFAIMICIIVPNLEDYTCFNDILHISRKGLWELNLYSSETQEEGFEDYVANHFKCACNHPCGPENLYIIHNIQTKKNILIGCECATKCGFLEPEVIEKIKARREDNPKYKQFMENSERKNEIKYIEEIEEQLKNLKITKEIIEKDYKYIGGNYGEHLTIFNKQKNAYRENDIELDDIDEYISDDCDTCNRKTKHKLLLTNEDGMYCICERCCSYFGKMPKKNGICDDCGSRHRNRSDNYCNKCRAKTICLKCKTRTWCFNSHCNDCIKKYNFCNDCKINEAPRKGLRCTACYNKLTRCKCGTPITNPRFKTCFKCK